MTDEMPLGKTVPYPDRYAPELLFAVPRSQHRAAMGLGDDLPFQGVDIWNAWELTWLDPRGMPRAAAAEIRIPADSPQLIESKSLKLYLNSFAMTPFGAEGDVARTITQDLGRCAGADVTVGLQPAGANEPQRVAEMPGTCLDTLRIDCDAESVDANLLSAAEDSMVSEQLHTHLLRSICPVTAQPDTGSILVDYEGRRIDGPGLLRYIVSYRQHQDFHEACVERMFIDILRRCEPAKLTVYARFQRRGGIDINPYRSNTVGKAENIRLWRQ
jgi:7-cyano-7-deazaguanine reductase